MRRWPIKSVRFENHPIRSLAQGINSETRLRWDRDPAFREPQDIGCPEWCHWGIENLGGICSSPLWNNGQCTYGMNHPSFEKTSFAVGEEYEHMLNTNNPHVFGLN